MDLNDTDNNFLIEKKEPPKKHEQNPTNDVEQDAKGMLAKLTDFAHTAEKASYATTGELLDVVTNLETFIENMPVSEWAQETYCKKIQEVANTVSNKTLKFLKEKLEKALDRLNSIIAPIRAILSLNPLDLSSIIEFCTALKDFFTAFIELLLGIIDSLNTLLLVINKLLQLPAKIIAKATELGCTFTPPEINIDNSEN